ncbi:hypothetical protein F7734_54635 [Scytonema sp. UIC 10036]|uniref:effector-associated domain EAD1-containing protein n=1 Tax=Scytonema sp. UIC 10036 TaxID=2304196 RepID=UPI0012DA51E9|nr:effector-associated domain EAD1-containing protein [Scytonema sp. UIC 10036]MUH00836.1 hypothetical protein [Scytonema sp. UIC 10036]
MMSHGEQNYEIEKQSWYAPNLPETQEIDENQCQSLKQEIDVVIMTATDVELKAVAKLLKPYPRKKKVFLAYVGPETYYLGKFGEYKTVVTKCRMGSIGEGSVILATEQAQRLWSPRAMIMVGIAFGKDPNKQKIADVLVASQIISYEQQRVGEEIVYRGSIPPSNTTLLNRFENAQNWKFTRPDGSHCNLIVGSILSGEKLVDNPDFKAQLFQQFPQAVGGEMEGAGLCAASGRVGTAWILVKSICDWGDGKKHKKHQPMAAAAAASLVHHVLSQKTVLSSIKKSGGEPQANVLSQKLADGNRPISNNSHSGKLAGSQRKQFCEALMDAFPSQNALKMMLSYELDWELDRIAGGNNYEEIVFSLIEYAKAQGKLIELLEAAKRDNPGNPKLRNVSF